MNTLGEIWADDLLGRKAEAELIQSVLIKEANERARSALGESYVLGLDAAYGEGKSFFLKKLRSQLEIDHPVAFIDAWVDDANDEPLLAIMAAINDALVPFLSQSDEVRSRLKEVTLAALPIFGKAVIGAATTFGKRYIGEEASKDISGIMGSNVLDDLNDGIGSLADKMGAEMLDAFKKRKESKNKFKKNMGDLVSAIGKRDFTKKNPLFVIIDELDRCRPSYAIKLLEEIKHLFEINGVVFIIALHGDQLEKSIEAVYGASFNSKAYLQRFFSRRYRLKRLTMRQLVSAHIAEFEIDDSKFSFPYVKYSERQNPERSLVAIFDAFFRYYGVTPREINPIMDGVRMFSQQWNDHISIELLFILGLLLRVVRALPHDAAISASDGSVAIQDMDETGTQNLVDFNKIWDDYRQLSQIKLHEINQANYRLTHSKFVVMALESEGRTLYPGGSFHGAQSVLRSYPARVDYFGRLLD